MTVTKRTRFERATTFALLAAGLSVAVIGLLALLGWVLDEPILTLWKAGTLPMAPSTAVLSVMFGAALCLDARMPQSHLALLLITLFGWVGAMTTLLLFALRFLDVYGSAELLGLRITGTFGNTPIGYISPITAFCFLLAYGSLLASLSHDARGSWRGWVLWGFGGLISLVSFALLLAYAFGTPLFFGKVLIPSALNTSLSLLITGLAQLVLAARYTVRAAASPDADAVRLLPYSLFFLVFAAATLVVAYYSYRSTELRFRQEVESQLLTVSELKTDELVRWRMERFWDGALSQNAAITAAVRRLLETPHSVSAQQEIQDFLGKYSRHIGYDRAFLLDAKGVTRMSVPDTAEPAAAILAERAAASLRMGQVMLQDFYRDEHDQHIYLALIVPILDQQDGNRPLGVVVLRIDPAIYLYPHIKRWPTPSASAETLLVRREGNDVLFLNDLRFRANAALALRFPLTRNTELPAAKAALGQGGIVDGVDYRGVPVIAAVRTVPDSPWHIVTRMDTAEVYAPLRERMWLTLLLVSILLCGAGAGAVAIFLWRQQKLAFYRREHELTLALQVKEERHRSILNTAMDGFWLIDMQARLLEVNETYCRMSGYSEQELLAMRIADLEAVETAEEITDRLQNIMMQGEDRFESRHRRKDGSIFEVEISIQYQPFEGGRCVVFVQDITHRKQVEAALQKSEEAYRMLFESSRDAIMTLNAEGNLLSGNLAAVALFGCRDEQEFITLSLATTSPEFQPDGRRSDEKAQEIIGLALNKGLHFFEWTHRLVDGTEFFANVLLTRMEFAGKKLLQATVRDITKRKQVEDTLKEIARVKSELLYKLNQAQHFAMIGSWEWDLQTNDVWWSDETYRIFGVTPQDYVPSFEANRKFIHSDDVTTYDKSFAHCFQTGEQLDLKLRLVANDGVLKYCHAKAEIVYDDSGQQIRFVGTIMDITERKQAEEQLRLAASVFTHAWEGIMITAADGTISDVNDAFSRITSYSRDEVLGKNPRFLSSGRQGKDFYAALWGDLVEKGLWYGEVWNRRKNGEVYIVMQTIITVRDDQSNTLHYVAMFSDITLLKEHENELEHIAHYDALTNLPNRTLLDDRLRQGMVQAQRHTHPLAVAFLDLDGFKDINDKHGHEAGDQLLIAVADRMKQALRKGDTIARLGGDEFVVVLLDLADVATSVPMLTRLLAAAAEPVQFGDITLQVSASLGASFYPQAEDIDADQLLRQANQSMYLAKQAGKNRYHFFDAEQDRIIRDRHESLERIRHALTAGEFVLYYQPKVNMRTGTIIGAEALIRWQHPEKGLLLLTVFLPVIEDHPLAVDIGEWVIDTALAQMDIWQASGLNIPVSVNVGARQLQQMNFVERLREMLVAHPTVRQGDLELEVLETSAMEDLTKISGVIDASRKIGVSFALDDFGTGYSSLTYLKRLPVSVLKIDQSFVRVMLDNLDDLSIVEGVLSLATAFRLQVIAEGVETIEHGTLLLQLGCDLAQGYGIARPMPAHQLPAWATTWQPNLVWAESPSFSHADLPLLFASVEHRAWLVAMEKYLKGEREVPPPINSHQCRFDQWLNTEGLVRCGTQPSFKAIEILHQQMHALAAELCELQAQGRNPKALARLGELHDLRDAFLEQLTLPQQSRQQVVKEV